MAIIRSKRATNNGAVNAGVPKGKYRKRSVSPVLLQDTAVQLIDIRCLQAAR